ncbi:hypothetical protein GCM10022393_10820 [Aquimarina addita]|uniref:Cardiolipin synthetase n=1 Tax=Aquimarina addita TaxID=870485 RepID=A0ABP7XDC2_9FLAO
MKILYTYIMIPLILSCSSSELVENWKNPEIDTFEAQKVLVVGITSDVKGRNIFEKKLTTSLQKNGVLAIKSLDFFDNSFTTSPKSGKELLAMESKLIAAGFDAILISKIVGEEDRVSVVQAYKNMDKTFGSFREDYYKNQRIYYEDNYYENYTVYLAETSLYCICSEKDRELIWKGSIEITEPDNVAKAVGDYVKVLIWGLREQQLLIIEEKQDEDIDL